ncbi:MAG TPA: aspartate kinase [Longimicrobiales bacterium]|nr:aspartate kinase [Longimicrobiales bacterium]
MTPPPRPHVFKFGGTSLADAPRIRHVADLVAERSPPPVVVVSALVGVTDSLEELGEAADPHARRGVVDALRRRHRDALEALGPEGPDRTAVAASLDAVFDRLASSLAASGDPHEDGRPDVSRSSDGPLPPHGSDRSPIGSHRSGGSPTAESTDRVLAAGEDLSARLMAYALRSAGRPAEVVDARLVVRTDARFGRALPDEEAIRTLARERLLPLLGGGVVPVVQGFVGATADGRTTTLGRGGSDFTAALLGAALGAERVHVWTDVDGILSGDPRAVQDARVLERIGFEEAVELSYFGARVLHPEAAKHAVARGVPLHIRNTFRPDGPGTLVLKERWGARGVAAVAFKPGVALIKVRSRPAALPYGFLARVFEVLARHRLPVDLVATSHSSTAFTLDEDEEIDAVSRELAEFSEVDVFRALATVTVVGRGLLAEPGVDGRVFREVGTTPIRLISQASDVSLSFMVDAEHAPDVVRRLHAALVTGGAGGEVENVRHVASLPADRDR